MSGKINAYQADITDITTEPEATIYIDPPYENTSGYDFNFDVYKQAKRLRQYGDVWVSEYKPLSTLSWLISDKPAKGNIAGGAAKRRFEWLSYFPKV